MPTRLGSSASTSTVLSVSRLRNFFQKYENENLDGQIT